MQSRRASPSVGYVAETGRGQRPIFPDDDESASRLTGAGAGSNQATPAGTAPVGVGTNSAAAPGISGSAAQGQSASMPTGVVVFYSVVAGWFAVYTIGWAWLAYTWWVTGSSAPLLNILANGILVLAAAAAALWMVTSIVATRGKSFIWTVVWLVVGIVLLFPWPYLVAAQGALVL